ncbi:MAG: hypothetical protein ACI9JN_000860 [Bacteroidia bacterium]
MSTEYGAGLGVSRILSFENNPRLRVDIGLGGLYVLKRNETHTYLNSNYASLLIETTARYRVYKHIYLLSELAWGYGKQRYLSRNGWNSWSFDIPYYFSFGIGYKLHEKVDWQLSNCAKHQITVTFSV